MAKRKKSARGRFKRKIKQEAPKREENQQPIRRIQDIVLSRMLDEHMLESLSDLGDLWQKLSSRLGAKSMKFEEHVRVNSSVSMNDRAIDFAAAIADWRNSCHRRKLDTRLVMSIISDALSVSGIVRKYKMNRYCVRSQIRACLGVWSFFRKRIAPKEVNILVHECWTCCRISKRRHIKQM